MTTKIEGPNAEVDASAAELARANERHTAANAAEVAILNRIGVEAMATEEQRAYAKRAGIPVQWVIDADAGIPKFIKMKGGAL